MHLLRRYRSGFLLLAIALAVFAADQATKIAVLNNLAVQESWSALAVFRGMISVTHVVNTGAAFGLFPDQGSLFIVIAMVVIVAIVSYYRYLPLEHVPVRVSLGLQLGGAMGNLVDRMRLGFVVDFIDFGFWPVFNLADVAVVAGVIILASYLLREEERGSEPDRLATAEGETARG